LRRALYALAIACLIALSSVEGIFYFQLSVKHEDLKSKYMELKSNYGSLVENYTKLQLGYKELIEDYSRLQDSYMTLNASYAGLADRYNELRDYFRQVEAYQKKLNETYHTLLESYKTVKGEYSKLEGELQKVNEAYLRYQEAYRKLAFQVNLRVVHPNGNESLFITPDDPEVRSKVLEITGGWSRKGDWSEFWIDVKKLYDWVVDNIVYRNDTLYPKLPDEPSGKVESIPEVWQFPNQTLMLGSGDCEDMAILLASMVYAYVDKEYWVEVIVITDHVAVYIPVKEGKICILDPGGRYYTGVGRPWGGLTARDIRGEVYRWLSYWSGRVENPEVKWVFSAYLWRVFAKPGENGTENFIDWMYSREL